MSNYVKAVNFAAKDALITGDPNKKAKGTEVDTEFNAIASMSGTKEDSTNKGAVSGYAALDVNQIVQGAGLNATGTVIPANGVYLPAANTLGFATATTQRLTINATGNAVYNAPSSGTTLTINPQSTNSTTTLTASGINLATGVTFLANTSELYSSNPFNIGTNTSNALGFYTGSILRASISSAGNFVHNAPSSGAALVINTAVGGDSLQLLSTSTDCVARFQSTTSGNVNLIMAAVGIQSWTLQVVRSTGALSFLVGGSTPTLSIASLGNVSIAAPTSGNSLTLNGTAAITYPLNIATTVARGGGLVTLVFNDPTGGKAQIGFPAAADDLYFSNELAGQIIFRTSATPRINITAVGQTTIYDPLNAINALKNAATYDTGTFTGTLTGCTTSPTGTINWSRVGNTVTLEVQSITATSNTTTCTITGVPANLVPVRGQINFALIFNNGTSAAGVAVISGTVISLYPGAINAAFTASGTKGSIAGFNLTYNLT